MAKRLTVILLATLILSLLLTLSGLYWLIESNRPEPEMHACDMSAIAYGLDVGFLLLMAISASTLYFDLHKKIRENKMLSLLAWFLLPVMTALALWYSVGDIFALLIVVPFLLILAGFYFLEQRRRRKIG